MKTMKMKIADLRHPEKNIRKHPAKQIQEMKRSLEKFGQFRPVVIDEANTILCGNGLVIAMSEMGYEEAEVLQYTNLTANDKKKLMIADNQVASLGVDDYAAIEEFIRSLDGDIDVPGYDEDTLRMIIDEADSAASAVMSYGVYDEEDVNTLKEVERDRAENGFQNAPVAATHPSEPVVSAPAAPVYSESEKDENKVYAKPQEADKYIICPHCGEKIYI